MTVNQSNRRRGLSLLKRIQVIQEFESTWPRTPFRHLADKFNVSSEHIRYIIYKKDKIIKAYEESLIPKANKPKPQMMKQLTLSQRFEILKLYDFSYPKVKIKELAAEFGVTGPLIRRVLDKQVEILKEYEKQCVKQSALYRFHESSDSSDDAHTLGVLNGIDRLAIMHEYNYTHPRPSKSSLAAKYKVSRRDISHILLDYDITILTRVQDEKRKEFNLREEQIKFLDMVMLEYLQRALCHDILPLDDETFQRKASQVIECIALTQFNPTSLWLYMFKRIHGIVDFTRESLASIRVDNKPKSLDTRDLIDYVCREKTRIFKENVIRKRNKQYSYYKRKQCKTYSTASNVTRCPIPQGLPTEKFGISPAHQTEYSNSPAIRKNVPQRFHSNILETSHLVKTFGRLSKPPEDEHIETFNFIFDKSGVTIKTEQEIRHETDETNSEASENHQFRSKARVSIKTKKLSPQGIDEINSETDEEPQEHSISAVRASIKAEQQLTHETADNNSEVDEGPHGESICVARVPIKAVQQSTHDSDEINLEVDEDPQEESIFIAVVPIQTHETDDINSEVDEYPQGASISIAEVPIKSEELSTHDTDDINSEAGEDHQNTSSSSVAGVTITTEPVDLESDSISNAVDAIKTFGVVLESEQIPTITIKIEQLSADETDEIKSETGEDYQRPRNLSARGVAIKSDMESESVDKIKIDPWEQETKKTISKKTSRAEEESPNETEEINADSFEDQHSRNMSIEGATIKADPEELESVHIEWLTGEKVPITSDSQAFEDVNLAACLSDTSAIEAELLMGCASIKTAQQRETTSKQISAGHHSPAPFTGSTNTSHNPYSRDPTEKIDSSLPLERLENIKIAVQIRKSSEGNSKNLCSVKRTGPIAQRPIAISKSREALRILQVLEKFFLANGNFRAIILLAQLKEALKEVPK